MSLPQETGKTVGGMQFGDHLCLLYDHERRAVLVAYIRDGLRADEKIIIDLAMVQGYTGVRATGEATWTLRGWPGSERFTEFEQKVDDAFRTSEINAMSICQYDRRWFSVKPLETLLHTHTDRVRMDDVYNDGVLRIAPTWTPPGLALHGAIEESTFAGLTSALTTIGEKTGHICLELGGVEFCDMAGLRTLLGAGTDDGLQRQLLLRNCPQHIQGLLKIALWESIPGVVVEES